MSIKFVCVDAEFCMKENCKYCHKHRCCDECIFEDDCLCEDCNSFDDCRYKNNLEIYAQQCGYDSYEDMLDEMREEYPWE